ncbi:MAG: glycoside hydrolase family 36 protein [Candidatus Merdivicinus sp.]|jgi:hypothetical protein
MQLDSLAKAFSLTYQLAGDSALSELSGRDLCFTEIPCPATDRLDDADTFQCFEAAHPLFRITRTFAWQNSGGKPDRIRIRTAVTNCSGHTLSLKNIAVLDISSDSSLWPAPHLAGKTFFSQSRHKNGLPSICHIGVSDDAYRDMLRNISENGKSVESGQEIAGLYASDQLTVIQTADTRFLFAGFLTAFSQMTDMTLRVNPQQDFESFRAECHFHIEMAPERTVETEWLRIENTTEPFAVIQDFAKTKARIHHARVGSKKPAVYCSWYYYGITVNQEDIRSNLAALHEKQIPFDVYQIDMGWETGEGDFSPNEKFPDGMKVLADEISEAGFIPGIWTSPFISEENEGIAAAKPQCMLKNKDGSPAIFPMGKQYHVLDITHPDTLCYLRELYTKLRRDWGYRYHKLDFTRAAILHEDADYYDKSIPLGEAYRRALQVVRDTIGEDSYLLVCGGLYDQLIGIVDAQRTGSDVLSTWDSIIKGGGMAAPFTIKQSLLRYFMNNWWHNDPDALMVRRRTEPFRDLHLSLGLLNDTEAFTLTLVQYLSGGIVCSTEPIAEIDRDRLELLRHIIPVVNTSSLPVDLFKANRYPSLIQTKVDTPMGSWYTLAFLNWSDQSVDFALSLTSGQTGIPLSTNARYHVSKFTSRIVRTSVSYGDSLPAISVPPHGSLLFRIQEAHPGTIQLLYSNAHFSMGGELSGLPQSPSDRSVLPFWPWHEQAEYLFTDPQGNLFRLTSNDSSL